MAVVVFITVVAGLAEYMNVLIHPELQPLLTVSITAIAVIADILTMWYWRMKSA